MRGKNVTFEVMTIQQFQTYKSNSKRIPRCICCFIPILKDDKFLNLNDKRCKGKTKFLCEEHARYYSKHGKIVHQYPMRQHRFVGQKLYGDNKARVDMTSSEGAACPLKRRIPHETTASTRTT